MKISKKIKSPISEELKSFERQFFNSVSSKITLLDLVLKYILKRKGKLKIIILGDGSLQSNDRIFNVINDLEIKTKKEIDIYYKPHPFNATKKLRFNGV